MQKQVQAPLGTNLNQTGAFLNSTRSGLGVVSPTSTAEAARVQKPAPTASGPGLNSAGIRHAIALEKLMQSKDSTDSVLQQMRQEQVGISEEEKYEIS